MKGSSSCSENENRGGGGTHLYGSWSRKSESKIPSYPAKKKAQLL